MSKDTVILIFLLIFTAILFFIPFKIDKLSIWGIENIRQKIVSGATYNAILWTITYLLI
jgi:hypothetical protein